MRAALLSCLALLIPVTAAAQSEPAPETLVFGGKTWRVTAQEARVETFEGRETLVLRGGRVWLDDASFSDGVIEFDARYEEVQGFIGPAWRATSDNRFEEIYFRSHLNNMPDAVQYTPVENGNSAWQIFSDGNAIASLSQTFEGWNHAKLVVIGDKADFYFNSDAPVLHVPDLKTDLKQGAIGLRATGPVTVRFSSVTHRPLTNQDRIAGEAKESPALPEGLIKSWTVSSVFSESKVENALMLPASILNDLDWQELAVETNGIANISRLRERLPDADGTVFVRLGISSDKAQMKELRFGYSDRVRIYLNGKRVYYGDAGWTVRDYRFLGTVGFFDSAGLDLKKGDNELLVAVSETFGGWAWAGAIEDQSGITLQD